MPRSLRKILPHKLVRKTQSAVTSAILVDAGNCALRIDGAHSDHDEAKSQPAERNIDDEETLEANVLENVNACLQALREVTPSSPAVKTVGRSPVRSNQTATSPEKPRKHTARVQLRLSKTSVRVLKAFSKTGKHPSAIVERALWRDPAVQDAAAILCVSKDK